MDIDGLASEFGSAKKSKADNSDLDISKLVTEFGSKPTSADTVADIPRLLVTRTPKPPISGISKEASDELNQTRTERFGEKNPRDSALTTGVKNYLPSIFEKIGSNFSEGGKEFSRGLSDVVNKGEVKEGSKKIGLGALGVVTAIPSALATEGVGKPIAEITGNSDIGNRAAFVAGSAIPILPGIGLISKARPKNVALKDLVDDITGGGANPENLAHVVQNMKSNSRLGPADLSPAVLSASQKLFNIEGSETKNYLAATSSARLATTKDTINTALNASMGASANAAKKVDDLKKAAQEIGKKNIEPVLASKPHTDVTDLIKHIDNEIGYPAMKTIKAGKQPPLPLTEYQRELLTVRNKLRSPDWPDRDKMFAYTDQLHDAQIKLREKAQGLTSSATGSERNTGKELLGFREKLKDAVGPEYKEALSKYAGQKKIEEAFHNGYDTILSNSKKLENDPSFFEKWVNSSARKPGELEAAKEGARLRIDAEIKGARTAATNPASKAIGIGQTEFNVQRLEALLGKEETSKLMQALDHARLEANTHNKLIEGSQTANRIAADSKRDLPIATPVKSGLDKLGTVASWIGPEAANIYGTGYMVPGLGLAASVAANTLPKLHNAAKDRIKMLLAKETNLKYAKYALPTEGPSRDALIKSLEAAIPGPKQSIVRRGANTLSRLVSP